VRPASRSSAQLAAPEGLTVHGGILISEVVMGDRAATAGLQAGDALVRLGATALGDQQSVPDALVPLKPGQRVAVTVASTREQRTVTCTRGELAVGGRRARPSVPLLLEHALSIPLQRDDRDLGRVVDP
jgi:S1-C subfamily serine protease